MQLYILASGSTGNAMVVATATTAVLIDAGLGPRQISSRLKHTPIVPQHIKACFITHEHSDHVRGLNTAIGKWGIPVVCNQQTWQAITTESPISAVLAHRELPTGDETRIGDIDVRSFATSHDAAEPVGYRFHHQGKVITIATDLGVVGSQVLQALQGSDEIVLESNHDLEMLWKGSYPWFLKRRVAGDQGHLSNLDAAKTLGQVLSPQTRKIHLAHLSQENNRPDVAQRTVKDYLIHSGAWSRQLEIHVAPPLHPPRVDHGPVQQVLLDAE